MKIISKYKDYYDFLQGVNGIDEKIVLDRTEFHPTEKFITEDTIFIFHICGFRVEGLYRNGKFLYGNELESLHTNQRVYFKDGNEDDYYTVKSTGRYSYNGDFYHILKNPKKYQEGKSPNDKLNCPILIECTFGKYKLESDNWHYSYPRMTNFDKFPIMKDHELSKVFSAEQIWIMLYNWLSKEKTIENKQTDKEKIASHGFDLKHSFRNTK